MSVQAVPTFRAAHLLPYLEFLHAKGDSVERELQRFHLPTSVADLPEMQLPLVPTAKFLSHIERTRGFHDLGPFASDNVTIKLLSPPTLKSILAAPTLGAALEIFTCKLGFESSVVEAWMQVEGTEVKLLKTHRISLEDEELRLMKIHFMLLVLAVIRAFAGPGWTPKVMVLGSPIPINPFTSSRYPGMRLQCGQSLSWISLPKDMLALRRVQTGSGQSNAAPCASPAVPILTSTDDFAASLKRVLKSYLPEGYPNIELAAQIAGTSVRTLQRNLARSGLTYSKLIEKARFEAALEMLGDSGAKIIDVAYAVGYEDPSHFSRAFRRMAGTTPRGFRISGAA